MANGKAFSCGEGGSQRETDDEITYIKLKVGLKNYNHLIFFNAIC